MQCALLIVVWLVLAGDLACTKGIGWFLERLLNKPLWVPAKLVLFGLPWALQWAAVVGIPFYLIRKLRPWLSSLRELPVPRGAVIALTLLACAQVGHLLFQKSVYPILHVGMFERSPGIGDYPSTVHRHKYYLDEPDGPRVIDIRRQGHFLFSDLLSWSNEISFSICYHNRDRQETFDYLQQELRNAGYDAPIRLGVEIYDFRTGENQFNPAPPRPLELDVYGKVSRKAVYDPLFRTP